MQCNDRKTYQIISNKKARATFRTIKSFTMQELLYNVFMYCGNSMLIPTFES